eukprot:Tamp_27482.p1 GENE.Tamp_27482~~Tamp_27482.p1  ORF type:complete len:191 (+),score=34.39 Tamp_27482:116-688(+)
MARYLGAVCGTHALLSGASILRGALTSAPPPVSEPAAATPASNSICVSCSRAAQHEKIVAKMYRGGGVDAACCTPDVTFEDPAARCTGIGELQEAFRALKRLHPKHISAPKAVPGDDAGSSRVLLHQQYLGFIELESELLVRTAPDGRISAFEERWNRVPLLEAAPFRFARRLNGLISYALTPLALPATE